MKRNVKRFLSLLAVLCLLLTVLPATNPVRVFAAESDPVTVEGPTVNITISKSAEVINNSELTTADGLEKNKSYLTITVTDKTGKELTLKELYRAEALSWKTSDENVAIPKGNYKSYYIYGIAPGTATITFTVNYEGEENSASVDITVEGSVLKDGGFEGSTGWHETAYWKVISTKNATPNHWGYDVNSTFNMTGGNNLFIRMPNGGDTETDGTVTIYQDVYLTPASYSFAAYIRRFPGFEQQDIVDGYDSYNTPVTVGAILLDANGNETETKYAETYKDDYKMGVGDFEACAVQFSVTEAGTYRLYLYAESEIHVGMGMQVDNMCLVSGQQIDRVEVSFGTDNTVKVNMAEALVFKAFYSDGTQVDLGDVRPTYLSSNTGVLSITSDNKVFGLAPGTANLTASVTVNGVEYKCTIEATVVGDEEPTTPPAPGGDSSAPGNNNDGGDNNTTIIIVAAAAVVVILAVVVICVVAKKKKNKK